MNDLAVDLMGLDRYDDAEALLRETVEIQRRVLGDEHPETRRSMNNLANTYRSQGQYDELVALREEILEISRRRFGDEHRETVTAMRFLGGAYCKQNRPDESDMLFLKALEISRRVLGEEDPETNELRANLACHAALGGRRDEAISYLRHALDNSWRSPSMWILDDPELASLHGDPEFEEIVKELKRRSEEGEEARGE